MEKLILTSDDSACLHRSFPPIFIVHDTRVCGRAQQSNRGGKNAIKRKRGRKRKKDPSERGGNERKRGKK